MPSSEVLIACGTRCYWHTGAHHLFLAVYKHFMEANRCH